MFHYSLAYQVSLFSNSTVVSVIPELDCELIIVPVSAEALLYVREET